MTAEYRTIREHVALIDYSDEGRFVTTGEDRIDFLNRLVGADLEELLEGRISNTLFLNQHGSILAIVWILKDEDRLVVFCEPEDRERMLAHLKAHAEGCEVAIEDVTAATFCYGIVGPDGEDVARSLFGDDIVGLSYLGFTAFDDPAVTVGRVGYVGEYECRIMGDIALKEEMAEKIRSAGAASDLAEVSRTLHPLLMAEMRSLNRVRDIPEGTNAVQAGLQWMIKFQKENFIGREELMEKKRAPGPKLITLLIEAEEGETVSTPAPVSIDGERLGELVSAHYSPRLGKVVGFAYIDEAFCWPNITFDLETRDGATRPTVSTSAPLFLTKTILKSMR